MTKIININDLAKMKEQHKEKLSKPKSSKKEEMVYSTDAKFIMLDGIQLGFGGAFQRDIIKHLNERREEVLNKVLTLYDKEISAIRHDPMVSAEVYLQIKLSFAVLKTTVVAFFSRLETVEQFDEIFDNETEELAFISEVVLAIAHTVYSEMDYQRMIRDRWCTIDSTLSEFLLSLDDLFDFGILEQSEKG